jgi:hypothetical protein
MSKLAYTLAEARDATGLSVSHFDEAIRSGRLKAKTTKARGEESSRNGKRVILAGELERYLGDLEDAE